MKWVEFQATKFTRTCFKGNITREHWSADKQSNRKDINSFCALDELLPSRFILAHTTNLDVAFLSIDPERIGESTDDGRLTDMGDDLLYYKGGRPIFTDEDDDEVDSLQDAIIIHPNVENFLLSELP